MSTDIIPDSEYALRTYLRAALPDVKVYFDPPKGSGVTFPMITIPGRIGGAPDSYVPIDEPRVSFQVWGGTGGDGRDKARQTVNRLVTALVTADNVQLDPGTLMYGADIDSILWLPDDSDADNVLARYVVDATLGVRST